MTRIVRMGTDKKGGRFEKNREGEGKIFYPQISQMNTDWR